MITSRIRTALQALRGAPLRTRSSQLWDAARTDRSTAGWDAISSDFAAYQIPPEILRRRARNAVKNSPIAARGVAALSSNVIGTGIKPMFRFSDRELKVLVQRLWNKFIDNCDFDGRVDFFGLQALCFEQQTTDGEFLIRRRIVNGQLKLQVLPAEFLDSCMTLPGVRMVGGVEFDEEGSRIAYHIYDSHPSDPIRKPRSVRVVASEVLHVFRGSIAGQVRGVTWFAPVLTKMNSTEQFDKATLTKAKVSALWCAFLRGGEPSSLNTSKDTDGTLTASLEPGSLLDIGNSEIEFPPHADVSPYSEFMKSLLRSIASGLGLPYSVLTGDLSDTSYSSARVGLIEFRKYMERLQWEYIFLFCRPIWRWWIEVETLAGRLPIPAGGIDEYLDGVKWTPPVAQMTDPQKETDAVIKAIRAGLTSREMEISKLGYDREELDAEIAAGNAAADELGLVMDSDPRYLTAQGQQQQGSNADAQAAG